MIVALLMWVLFGRFSRVFPGAFVLGRAKCKVCCWDNFRGFGASKV